MSGKYGFPVPFTVVLPGDSETFLLQQSLVCQLDDNNGVLILKPDKIDRNSLHY